MHRSHSLFTRPLHLLVALAVLLVPLFGFVLTVHAANFTVTSLADDGPGSLRQAIIAANATTDTDSISFDVTGTIVLQNSLPTISGKLFINGPGASSLTISGNNAVRVFNLDSGSDLTLDGVTVANALGDSFANGGAINNTKGTLTISDSIFSNNSAAVFPSGGYPGGGIYNSGGTLTISNSTFSNNSADNNGGGIYNQGSTLIISNSTFTNNSATSIGGGIYNDSTLIISNSTFSHNTSVRSVGGGIYNGGTLTLSNSTFTNNRASSGGAIRNDGPLTVSGSTFAFNSADSGGGIAFSERVEAQTVQNTIISNSLSGGNCLIEDGSTLTDNGGNLSSDGTCFTASTSRINTDPKLDPNGLQDNGGATHTIALQSDSPAIDFAVDCPPPATDQRGVSRPQGAACDSGAFERVPPAPTNTPVPPTNTATNTPTITASATNTSTPTTTPTSTSTPLPVQSTIIASADSYVQKTDPKKNFGTNTKLIVDGIDDPREVYVRFSVNAAGMIRKAVLRLYVTDGSKDGPKLYQAANTTWSESAIIWNNRPGATGSVLGNLGKVNDKVWVEYDVTALVRSNGTYSFVLVGDSTESVEFASRESSNKPQLVLTVQP